MLETLTIVGRLLTMSQEALDRAISDVVTADPVRNTEQYMSHLLRCHTYLKRAVDNLEQLIRSW